VSDRDNERSSLEERSSRAFAESVDGLSAEVRSKLAQARQRALTAGPSHGVAAFPRRFAWVPAAAAALLVAYLQWGRPGEEVRPPGAPLGDMEILLAEEDLAMFEDLEFYTWLEEQPEITPSQGSGDGVG
jgi:hypothetical protein